MILLSRPRGDGIFVMEVAFMKKNLLFKLSALLLLLCGIGDIVWLIHKSALIPGFHIHFQAPYFSYCAFLIISALVKMTAGASAVIPKITSGPISLVLGIVSALFGTLDAIVFFYHHLLLNAALLIAGICASMLLIILHPINHPRKEYVSRLCLGILLILCAFFTILFIAMHFHDVFSAYVYVPKTYPLSVLTQRLIRIALYRSIHQLIAGIAVLLPIKVSKGLFLRCTAALLNIIVNTVLPWNQFGLKSICIWLPMSVAISAVYLFTLFIFTRQKQQLQESLPV